MLQASRHAMRSTCNACGCSNLPLHQRSFAYIRNSSIYASTVTSSDSSSAHASAAARASGLIVRASQNQSGAAIRLGSITQREVKKEKLGLIADQSGCKMQGAVSVGRRRARFWLKRCTCQVRARRDCWQQCACAREGRCCCGSSCLRSMSRLTSFFFFLHLLLIALLEDPCTRCWT